MGNTIEIILQWSSSEPSDRKLQSSPVNDWVLTKIADFVTTFETLHELETSFVFRHSLKWKSEMCSNELGAMEGFTNRDDDVVSENACSKGKALLTLSKTDTGMVMKVRSFKGLGRALKIMGNRTHKEIKSCIEANPRPVSAILGKEYRHHDDGKKLTEQLILALSQQDNQLHGVDQRIIDQQLAFRIFLLFKEFDEQLLVDVIKLLSNEPKQSPEDVDTVMNSLQQVLEDEPGLIEIVQWTPPYSIVFGNGFRAPFWRQKFGDISYIEVQLKYPCERLYMTASTSGYFVNKGPFNDFREHDFERKSPLYPDVVTLLRQYNKEVADRVDKELHKLLERKRRNTAEPEPHIANQGSNERQRPVTNALIGAGAAAAAVIGTDVATGGVGGTVNQVVRAISSHHLTAVQRNVLLVCVIICSIAFLLMAIAQFVH